MLIVSSTQGKKKGLTIRETALFAMLGTLMFCSKILMEFLPNIHLLGMFTMVYTLAFRKKALIPIYVSVLLTGLYFGFNMWWLPYIYIWTILWAVTMALPRNMSKKARYIVYPIVCCLHGLLYGTLYAPAQALMMGLGFKAMLAWIVSGLPWDLVHGAGNLVAGLLIVPLAELLGKLQKANISI
ncbi:MAG: hypothetical protein GX264_04610 [Clostridiales bacterium]|jgi:energy-coupling factor transport system substrate-specific component|nr:hypothetical protein [Clostridiales bacterium]